MINGETPKFVIKISEFFEQRILKLEIVIIMTSLIGIILLKVSKEIGEIILDFSLILLAVAYYFMGLKYLENKYEKFIIRLTYYSYTVALISILFVLLSWPGGIFFYQVGLVAIGMTIILTFILDKFFKKISIVDNYNYLRTFVFLIIMLLLQLTQGYKDLKESEATKAKVETIEKK
jgi:hypothetical protein